MMYTAVRRGDTEPSPSPPSPFSSNGLVPVPQDDLSALPSYQQEKPGERERVVPPTSASNPFSRQLRLYAVLFATCAAMIGLSLVGEVLVSSLSVLLLRPITPSSVAISAEGARLAPLIGLESAAPTGNAGNLRGDDGKVLGDSPESNNPNRTDKIHKAPHPTPLQRHWPVPPETPQTAAPAEHQPNPEGPTETATSAPSIKGPSGAPTVHDPLEDAVRVWHSDDEATTAKWLEEAREACQIYCEGRILEAVQRHKIFQDSKEFVDMPMKAPADEIMKAFDKELPNNYSRADLRSFVFKYFFPAGSDVLPQVLPDWREEPPLLRTIKDPDLRNWAKSVNGLWRVLGRSVRVQDRTRHSLLPSQNPLVVPGGRFRESYYWDTLWIVKGLLACGMVQTAKGIVGNLFGLVQLFGFVPNGGRIYYMHRSQPPMLSEMVKTIFEETADIAFLTGAVPILEKEYQFWMSPASGHAINVSSDNQTFILNRYSAAASSPRPEAWREDTATAALLTSEEERVRFYSNIRTAAETGWDFSSRWMRNQLKLSTVMTTNILPVDLNVIIYRYERNMESFYRRLYAEYKREEDKEREKAFAMAAERRAEAVHTLLWNESSYSWHDYYLHKRRHSPVISIANFLPLWAGIPMPQLGVDPERVVGTFLSSGLLEVGGVRTTPLVTFQQWDSPNAWAPLQEMMIEGMLSAGKLGKEVAGNLTRTFLGTTYTAWKATGYMFEKYNALEYGVGGGGGEYKPQVGFGWTNGVVLDLLRRHAETLSISHFPRVSPSTHGKDGVVEPGELSGRERRRGRKGDSTGDARKVDGQEH